MARSSAQVAPAPGAPRAVLDATAYPSWAGWLGVLTVGLGTAVALVDQHAGHQSDTRSLVAIWLSFAVVARGVGLRRPLLLGHLVAALAILLLTGVALERGDVGFAQVSVVLTGLVAFWPPPGPEPGTPSDRRRVATLVQASRGDPLAPFALRADKSYLYSPDGLAAVGYRVRFAVVVVSGDPVGAPESLESAAEAIREFAGAHGWRLSVLGSSQRWSRWWQANGYRGVPIGRDVVIDVASFAMNGRAFRNLRQAVQRTRNAGVTTEIYKERGLPPELRESLQAIVAASHRDEHRGFSMIMDQLLEPEQAGNSIVAVAFDRSGRPVAFHRFGIAGGGADVSQDLPWRAAGAPNGVDERLAHDTVVWARDRGAERLSLSFAAFPELYQTAPTGLFARLSYWATHRLDRYIRLESLYRYLRKFHALGDQRFVMLRLRDLLPVAAAMLTLEFIPIRGEKIGHRLRHRRRGGGQNGT